MSNIQKNSLQHNKNLTRLFDTIKTIEDPRRTSQHPFESVMIIIICAMLGGANNAVSIEEFGKDHIEWFKKIIDLPLGVPSHDTFTRLINKMHPQELQKLLEIAQIDRKQGSINEYNQDNITESEALERHISVDGKSLRALSEYKASTLVRAFFEKTKSILTQIRVGDKTNEITVIPKILQILRSYVLGAIITIDAIGTQRKIVKQIVELQGYYVLPVKGNQHQLHSDLKLFLDDLADGKMPHASHTYHETIEKNSGRIEKRRCWSTESLKWLRNKKRWKNLTSASIIETTITKGKQLMVTRRYYISNLHAHANIILAIVRNHWGIENKLHWPLNVAFHEHISTTRKGRGAENFSILRCFALSLLQNNKAQLSINNKRARAARNTDYLLELLIGEKIDFSPPKTYSQVLSGYINYGIDTLIQCIHAMQFS